MKPAKPITIPDELAARYTEPDQFKKFDAAVKKILAVPRAEILRREAEYKKQSTVGRKSPPSERKPTAWSGSLGKVRRLADAQADYKTLVPRKEPPINGTPQMDRHP